MDEEGDFEPIMVYTGPSDKAQKIHSVFWRPKAKDCCLYKVRGDRR